MSSIIAFQPNLRSNRKGLKVSGLIGNSNSDPCDGGTVSWLLCGSIIRLIINPQWFAALVWNNLAIPVADELEHATPLDSFHGVFIDGFIFRSNFPGMRLPWEFHDQSQETYWQHCVTGPELPFFHKRKSILKIDQPAKMPWNRLCMGVACSYSLASGQFTHSGAQVGKKGEI